jgi:hypothetical protein
VKVTQRSQSSPQISDPNPANNSPPPIFAPNLNFCYLLSALPTQFFVSASGYRGQDVPKSLSRPVEVGELDQSMSRALFRTRQCRSHESAVGAPFRFQPVEELSTGEKIYISTDIFTLMDERMRLA